MSLRKILVLTLLALVASTPGWAQNINAAGATFPYPLYSKWFEEYHKLHPNVQINYQSIGSGAGQAQLMQGTVDFGASDVPMADAQLAQAKIKILHFPTVLGGVVPTYNIPGVTADLKFTPDALAAIFLGKITKWNDPAIVGANPGVKLPGDDIVVIHRSDGSGTTGIFTDYLSKISPEWKMKVGQGTSVNWPVGLGGKGNEGVAGLIKQTPDSLGYVDQIYAIQNNLTYGAIRNAAGVFVKASLAGLSSAAGSATMPPDFRVSITNAPGKDAYPIASFTYLLIPVQISDTAKLDAIKGFLHWMLTDGQADCEALAYAKLPKSLVAKEEQQINEVH